MYTNNFVQESMLKFNKRYLTQVVVSVLGGFFLSGFVSQAYAQEPVFTIPNFTLTSPAFTAASFTQTATPLLANLNNHFRITILKNKSKPKPKPTQTPTPTPTPKESVKTAEDLDEPTATPSQTVTPAQDAVATAGTSTPGGLNADILFGMVNSHRTGMGLPAFQTDPRVCTLANERAPEVGPEIAEGRMHAGKNSHDFPYWFTENIISMNSEAAAFDWWIHDEIHKEAIEGNYTYSCMACQANSCVEEFTNFEPK